MGNMTLFIAGIAILSLGTYLMRLGGAKLGNRLAFSERSQALLSDAATVLLFSVALATTFYEGAHFAGMARVLGVAFAVFLAWRKVPLIGVIICSSLLGIPGGTIASANPTVLAIVAPLNLRDKVLGWHNSLMMLGMATFQLLGGIFGETGRFQDGYKTVLILIPILVLVILFYPNVDKDRSLAQAAGGAQETETVPARDGKFPMVAVGMLLLYLFGAIFWNAWFMNYSDYIVNEAQLGTTAMAGVIGSLCSVAGTVSGLVVAFWIKATKRFSMTLAFILCGVAMLLPQLTQSAAGCYAGGILCQFFNLIVVSGLTTYLGLATTGKNATTAMSLLAGIEGSGVFLCGYIVPVVGNLFGGGAGMNIMVSGIILMVIGVAAYFVIKPTHEMVYGKKNTDQQHG